MKIWIETYVHGKKTFRISFSLLYLIIIQECLSLQFRIAGIIYPIPSFKMIIWIAFVVISQFNLTLQAYKPSRAVFFGSIWGRIWPTEPRAIPKVWRPIRLDCSKYVYILSITRMENFQASTMSGEEYGCNVMELRNLMDLRSKQALDKVLTLILILWLYRLALEYASYHSMCSPPNRQRLWRCLSQSHEWGLINPNLSHPLSLHFSFYLKIFVPALNRWRFSLSLSLTT